MLLATSFAAPDVRKVPPRTPPQRLETLLRFMQGYARAEVLPYRKKRGERMEGTTTSSIYNRLIDNYLKADEVTGLRLCSFFDPQVPNGGPRLDNTGKRAAKRW